jgi:N-acetylneuraminic acid mutarotase
MAAIGAGRASRSATLQPAADVRYVSSVGVRTIVLAVAAVAACAPGESRRDSNAEHVVRAVDAALSRIRRPSGRAMTIALPDTASEPVRLSFADAALTITPLDLVAARFVDRLGARVAIDVRIATDVVLRRESSWFEEARYLRAPEAAHDGVVERFRAEGLDVRARGDVLEAIDATGRARFVTAPLIAVDAAGRERALSAEIRDRVVTLRLDTRGLAYPIVVDPMWRTTGELATPRSFGHTATRLPSGKVLVAGGVANIIGTAMPHAEVFDPATRSWAAVARMNVARRDHAAVLLANGKVLVAGGASESSAELYDPATNTWSMTGAMSIAREFATITALDDGTALVVGGSTTSSSAERYQPSSGAFVAAGSTSVVHFKHAAARLSSGKVLVAGGETGGSAISNVDLYDGAWASAPSMLAARAGPTATTAGTRVLVAGGDNLSTAEVYNATSNAWSSTGAMSTVRDDHAAALLPNGHVAVIGGSRRVGTSTFFVSTSEAWDPTAGTFAALPTVMFPRARPVATTLTDGRILVVGGDGGAGDADILSWLANGATCAAATECISTFCVDGLCCNAPCVDACMACDVTPGTCAAVTGAPHGTRTCAPAAKCESGACATTCSADTDCAAGAFCNAGTCANKGVDGTKCTANNGCLSGICTDGYCCNSACTGQCEACDNAGREGLCAPAMGAPHGSRMACAKGASTCEARACDGTVRESCTAFAADAKVTCAEARCDGTSLILAATCDGAGACATPISTSCVPYTCEAGTCRTSCTTNEQCAAGLSCSDGRCIGSATCADDGRVSVDPEGVRTPCGKYRCRTDGRCGDACGASSDCSPGFICDTNARTCVAPAPTAAEDSGCSTGGRAQSPAWALLVFAMVLAGLRRRVAFVAVAAVGCSADLPRERLGTTSAAVAWTPGTAPSSPRGVEIAVMLTTGNVLVTGGERSFGTGDLSTSELFDPIAGTWTTTGSLVTARRYPSGAPLPGGGALVLGGVGSSMLLTSAERYTGGTFVSLGASEHAEGSLTALPSGKVLIAGGAGNSLCEVFDPTSGTFAATGALSGSRDNHLGVALADGRVIIIGGGYSIGPMHSSAELWSPSTNAWTSAGAMAEPRFRGHAAVLLSTNKVLVAGGTNQFGDLSTAELYDPATNTWSAAASMSRRRNALALARLANGKVLAVGGSAEGKSLVSTAELYDPATNRWIPAGNDTRPRVGPFAFPFAGGTRVVILGGGGGVVMPPSFFEQQALGASCAADGECTSGFCADGVCCDKACSGTCEACNVAGLVGACSPVSGPPRGARPACPAPFACRSGSCATSCIDDVACISGHYCLAGTCVPRKTNGIICGDARECASDHCVDDRCCNSACSGTCEACDVAGSLGTCSPVKGAPHSARACVDDSGGDVCRLRACDGTVDRSKCTAYASGPSTQCKAASCDASSVLPPSTCDGAGACKATAAASCAPFACAAGACRTSCTTGNDCAEGFLCSKGACTAPPPARCSDDRQSSIAGELTTSCVPYLCGGTANTCQTRCTSSTECAAGFSCDVAAAACVPLTPEPEDSGCALGGQRPSNDRALVVLATLVAWIVRSRSSGARGRARDRSR